MVTKQLHTVSEASKLGIGKTTKIYELIAAGKLRAVKCGSKTLITNLAEFIENLPPASITMPRTMARLDERRQLGSKARRVSLDDSVSK